MRLLSDSGLQFIAAREAYRAEPYRDGTVWESGAPRFAIGYGHTIPEGQEQQWGSLDRSQAMELFKKDLEPRVKAVDAMAKIPLTQHQFDALVSLAFNIGVEALRRSKLLGYLNRGDIEHARGEFMAWNKWRPRRGGPLEVSTGLTLRRKLDLEFFDTPDDTSLLDLLARAEPLQFDLQHLARVGPHMHDEDSEKAT